ncbi:MAG: hypothetical protein WCG55_04085 [bacterium]
MNEETKNINTEQELFCRAYTRTGTTFGNATLSYSEAYGHDFEALESTEKKDRLKHYCAVSGSRLMRNDDIIKRIQDLLNELIDEKAVDSELAWLIVQKEDLSAKLGAIREYNRVNNRVTKNMKLAFDQLPEPIVDLTTLGIPH